MMKLKEFIESIGDAEAARLFGVTIRCAAGWRRGERIPNRRNAVKIISASNGAIAFEDLYR
jgi:hypothetical protein